MNQTKQLKIVIGKNHNEANGKLQNQQSIFTASFETKSVENANC